MFQTVLGTATVAAIGSLVLSELLPSAPDTSQVAVVESIAFTGPEMSPGETQRGLVEWQIREPDGTVFRMSKYADFIYREK